MTHRTNFMPLIVITVILLVLLALGVASAAFYLVKP